MDVELKLLRRRYESLETDYEILNEKYIALKNLLEPQFKFPLEWKFTPMEQKVLSMFIGRSGLFLKESFYVLYSDSLEIPDEKLLQVWICRLRQKFVKYNMPIYIENMPRYGYQMSKQSVEFLEKFITKVEIDKKLKAI